MTPRAAAISALTAVLNGRSLSDRLQEKSTQFADPRDQSLFKMLCYGICRWYFELAGACEMLLNHPLKSKDQDVYLTILLGLFQLMHTDMPAHAVVSETVSLCGKKKPWAKNLVNAILRQYLRRTEEIKTRLRQNPVTHFAHPDWMIKKINSDYPAEVEKILEANNQQPPMILRVNLLKNTRERYLAELAALRLQADILPEIPCGIRLHHPVNVADLPGFSEGRVSVQDGAAQLAALLLSPCPGERVLDACAAPGGKTAHLLELQPRMAALVAIDQDKERLKRVAENLAREQLACTLVTADAGDVAAWWDGKLFDCILLDAPCSASGVIRRHPDIKLLRRETDLAKLAVEQKRLLSALWPLLKPCGRLLYATCSVFAEENRGVIDNFMQGREDVSDRRDRQVLPGESNLDGFYYALLTKHD